MTTLTHLIPRRQAAMILLALIPLVAPFSPREAHASGPPLTPLVTATLAHLTSFQARMTATSQGAEAATFGRTVSAVRRGGQWQFDIIEGTRPRGAGDTTVVEYVISGETVCSRVSFNVPRGAFMCARAPRAAAELAGAALPILNALPPAARQSNTYTYTRDGTARLHGLLCDAYRYVVRSRTALERSALYLNHATGTPCEQDATTVGQPLFGLGPTVGPTGTATTTSLTVWSRFNDPTLTIPRALPPVY